MITVGMGYWRCPDYVERAVRSVLDGTYRDLRLVVIGDGEEPPLAVRDDRLEVYTLPENRGAYFALQLALLSSDTRWFAPFGADDWAEPGHFAQLMARTGAGADAVATGAVITNNGSIHKGLYEVGVFSRRRMLAIGGYNYAERIGQDTLMLRLLRITGGLSSVTRPTYHRVKRPHALTTSKATGHGSHARNEMRARNRLVYAECERLREPAAIRAYRESLIPAHLRDEMAEHVERLSTRLGTQVAA